MLNRAQYNQLQREHGLWDEKKGQATALQVLAKADWGWKRSLFQLYTGPCVEGVFGYSPASPLVTTLKLTPSSSYSDKALRGGSATVVPKKYLFKVCPCRSVTQTEYLPDEWERAENARKGVEEAAVAGDGQADGARNRTTADSTLLGKCIPPPATAHMSDANTQRYV